jgi:PAS domain S-box-containing protein
MSTAGDASISVLFITADGGFADRVKEEIETRVGSIEVETAMTPDAGADRLADGSIDCVLVDYDLPESDGLAVLSTVRDRWDSMPVILYAEDGSELVASTAISRGVSDYVQRLPQNPQYDSLADRIRSVCDEQSVGKAVSETAEEFRELVETTDDIMFVFDDGWDELVFINTAYEAVWGQSVERLRADPSSFLEHIHPEDRQLAERSMERSSNGHQTSVEYRVRTDDGKQRWIKGKTWPIFDEEGSVSKIAGFVRDVTEYKERERELAEERNRWESLVEQSHDGILIVQDGEFVYANPMAETILSRTESDLVGQPITTVVAPEDEQLVRNRYEERMDAEKDAPPSRYTVSFVRPTGEKRVAELSVAEITYQEDPAAMAVIRDVTERKRAEEQLATRTAEFEALNRLVRHDIRNDMAVILGWASTMGQYVEEDGQQFLDKIMHSGEHVVELTETARDYAETLSKDETPELESIPLRPVLSTEIERRRESYPDATIEIDGAIPAVTVTANDMLSSVYRNLLNNAVQHNDTEEPLVTVDVTEHGASVTVRVRDNGPGIPDGQKETVFGQGEMGMDSQGTGIGLYLVESLVDGYGGSVWIEDNEPRGTIVVTELPKAT